MGIHPPTDEQARPAPLAGLDFGALSGDPRLQAILRLAAHICGAPMGVVSIVRAQEAGQEEERAAAQEERPLAAVGYDPADGSPVDAVSMSVVAAGLIEPATGGHREVSEEPAVLLVPDARRDPRFTAHPYISGVPDPVRFFAAAPLRLPGGGVAGLLCVFDTGREHSLTAGQRRHLAELADLAVTVMELHRRTRLLDSAMRTARLASHELERSTTALSRFADQIGRDMKNPVTGVQSFLQRLADLSSVGTDPEAMHYVNRALTGTGRINAVVNAVLEHASVGNALDIGPVDLGAMVGDILDRLESEIRTARARVTVGRMPTVSGDAAQLRAVMHNLISNAVRYRHPRRLCKVQIAGERVESGWIIRVADNGVGIPPERRFEVLQLFTRAPGEPVGTGPETDGHGIGLATCRRIIEAHQGDILLEDTPGGGTTVAFHLPNWDIPVLRNNSAAGHGGR